MKSGGSINRCIPLALVPSRTHSSHRRTDLRWITARLPSRIACSYSTFTVLDCFKLLGFFEFSNQLGNRVWAWFSFRAAQIFRLSDSLTSDTNGIGWTHAHINKRSLRSRFLPCPRARGKRFSMCDWHYTRIVVCKFTTIL